MWLNIISKNIFNSYKKIFVDHFLNTVFIRGIKFMLRDLSITMLNNE